MKSGAVLSASALMQSLYNKWKRQNTPASEEGNRPIALIPPGLYNRWVMLGEFSCQHIMYPVLGRESEAKELKEKVDSSE